MHIQRTRLGTMVVKIARIAAWLLVAAIVVMTLGPPTVRPVSGFNRSLEHVAAFALLGLAFGLAYPSRRMLLALIGVAVLERGPHYVQDTEHVILVRWLNDERGVFE